MKALVLQENLSKAISIVSRLATTKSQLPILANILLKTEKGRLKLSATNLETGINFYIGAKIEEEGAITVPAKTLVELLSSLSAEKINLETKGDSLKIFSSNFKVRMNGINASEFPKIPQFAEKPSLVFKVEDFKRIVDQVAFAAASDESRPVLAGVKMEMKDGGLIWVATDGYRLSFKKLKETGQKSEEFKSLIVPARTLLAVSRIRDDGEVGMMVLKEKGQLGFKLEDVEVVTRLIEGEFPSFQKIIPEEWKTRVVIDKDQLVRAVKIASIFARESANIVKLEVSNEKLEVSANAPQVGSNTSLVEVKVEGDKNKIAFNFRYLLEFLSFVSSQEIVFEMTGPLNPGVFRQKGDASFFHIVMPVRVQE